MSDRSKLLHKVKKYRSYLNLNPNSHDLQHKLNKYINKLNILQGGDLSEAQQKMLNELVGDKYLKIDMPSTDKSPFTKINDAIDKLAARIKNLGDCIPKATVTALLNQIKAEFMSKMKTQPINVSSVTAKLEELKSSVDAIEKSQKVKKSGAEDEEPDYITVEKSQKVKKSGAEDEEPDYMTAEEMNSDTTPETTVGGSLFERMLNYKYNIN